MLHDDHAGRKGLGAQMSHAMLAEYVREELLATPRDDRMRYEVALIDELRLDGRRGDRSVRPT